MKKPIQLLIILVVFLMYQAPARADVSVTLKLDRNEATLMDSITMAVKLSGARKSDAGPTIKGLEAFDVTRRGTSSRFEIINGQVSAGIDYQYLIQPKRKGIFQVGPAEVKIKGRTYKSNSETLKIVETKRSTGAHRGSMFLNATLSSKEVYVEEQALYILKLYRKRRVSDLSLSLPEAENLSFKQLGKPVEYRSLYNGESYQVLEVRYALIASKEGVYGIRSSRMNLTVFESEKRSPGSLFDDPFFSMSTRRPMSLDSEPLELKVVSLPAKGRPADFSGLVGSFEISSILEPSRINVGESATLTVRLTGRGNIKRIPDLKIPQLEETKVYADQPVLEEKSDSRGLAGTKTMKWALVPEREGTRRIPSLSVTFFDTGRRTYRSIKTRPLSLKVLPGRTEQIQASAGPQKEGVTEGPEKKAVKEIGHDILPVHTSLKGISDASEGHREEPVFVAVLFLPFFVYGGTLCFLKIGRKSPACMSVAKAKRAAKTFIGQCRQEDVTSDDLILFITEYFNDRFGLSLGSLTPDEAAAILQTKGVGPETTVKIRDVMQSLEDLVYTGKGAGPCQVGEDIPELIRQIEKEIR
jgi:hypothetical protein